MGLTRFGTAQSMAARDYPRTAAPYFPGIQVENEMKKVWAYMEWARKWR